MRDGDVGDVGRDDVEGETRRVEERLRGCGRTVEDVEVDGASGAVFSDSNGGRGRVASREGISDSEARRNGVGKTGRSVAA